MWVGVGVCSPYPSRHRGVCPLFELGVGGKAVPHDVRRVILVAELRATLKQEVYDEELDAGVHACKESNHRHINSLKKYKIKEVK